MDETIAVEMSLEEWKIIAYLAEQGLARQRVAGASEHKPGSNCLAEFEQVAILFAIRLPQDATYYLLRRGTPPPHPTSPTEA